MAHLLLGNMWANAERFSFGDSTPFTQRMPSGGAVLLVPWRPDVSAWRHPHLVGDMETRSVWLFLLD
jgi:hypothetical protein